MTHTVIVQQLESVAECFAAARAADSEITLFIDRSVQAVRRRGELLLKAKEAAGHGSWAAALKQHWPGLPERTARHYMAQAKSANLADLKARISATTNPLESDADLAELCPHYSRAREALRRWPEIIDEVEAIEDVNDKLSAFARIANDHDLETMAAEIKLRAMRHVGLLSKELKELKQASDTAVSL